MTVRRVAVLDRLERIAQRACAAGAASPIARRLALDPVVTVLGYRLATLAALAWGAALSTGRLERREGLVVARGCPHWAFGRGGTTIGGVYLTHDNDAAHVIEHEAVHRDQWHRYGLAFIPLYVAAGSRAESNRFEREAGLENGGYR